MSHFNVLLLILKELFPNPKIEQREGKTKEDSNLRNKNSLGRLGLIWKKGIKDFSIVFWTTIVGIFAFDILLHYNTDDTFKENLWKSVKQLSMYRVVRERHQKKFPWQRNEWWLWTTWWFKSLPGIVFFGSMTMSK